jgi:PKD repeat protein
MFILLYHWGFLVSRSAIEPCKSPQSVNGVNLMEHHSMGYFFCIAGLVLLIGTVSAAIDPVVNNTIIGQSAIVFIGEQGLNVTHALNQAQGTSPDGIPPLTTIGWWPSAALVSRTSPVKTIELNERYTSLTVAQGDFVGYTGNWYVLQDNGFSSAGLAFIVADPTLGITVWDFDHESDVTGGAVLQGTRLGFRVDTNMYAATYDPFRSPINPATDGYIDIWVKNESGGRLSALYNDSVSAGTVAGPNSLKGDFVTTQPWFWGSSHTAWQTGARDASGQYVTPPGTYAIWAVSNLNNMRTNYKIAGADYTGKTVSPTCTVTIVPPLPGTEPVAAFSANITEGDMPLTVKFTDASTNAPTSWAWDFNNDGTIESTEQNPVYTYTSNGTYTISLNATNADGYNILRNTGYITVTLPPSTVTLSSSRIAGPGGRTTLLLVMDKAPAGLSGYAVNLTYDKTVVNITQATFPAWASLKSAKGLGEANDLRLMAVDLLKKVQPGATNIEFATITVEGIRPGTTSINITRFEIDDAAGHGIYPTLINGTVTILSVPPVAAFTGTPTSGTVPLTVEFTDASTYSPTNWTWDFGDGGASAVQNATHLFTTAGTYTVNLTVTNASGSTTVTRIGYIHVTPYANFTTNITAGPAPLSIRFTDTSTGTPTSWNWSFGNGRYSRYKNFIYTYNTGGVYTLTLTSTNAGGDNTITRTDYIHVTPGANFITNITSGPAPLTVKFTDTSTGSPTAWNYSFGNGRFSKYKNMAYTYTAGGVYTLTLTSTNAGGDNTITRTDYIHVTPGASFTTNITAGPAPLTVRFTDTSTGNPTAWNYSFGNGRFSKYRNMYYTYATAGTYTVSLTATNAAGNNTITKTNYITVS